MKVMNYDICLIFSQVHLLIWWHYFNTRKKSNTIKLKADFVITRLGLTDLFPASEYQSYFKMFSAKSSLSSTNDYYRPIAPSASGARNSFYKNVNLFFNPVLLLFLVFLFSLLLAGLFNL